MLMKSPNSTANGFEFLAAIIFQSIVNHELHVRRRLQFSNLKLLSYTKKKVNDIVIDSWNNYFSILKADVVICVVEIKTTVQEKIFNLI